MLDHACFIEAYAAPEICGMFVLAIANGLFAVEKRAVFA